MGKRVALILFAFCLLSLSAWAQTPGPTTPPLAVENPEIIYNPLTPHRVTSFLPPPLFPSGPKAAEDIGAYYMDRYDNYAWSVNPTVGDLTEPDLPSLSATMQAAVDIAPDWMKPALARRFLEIDEDLAEDLADMIANPEDDLYTDELAFSVAYICEYDLRNIIDPVDFLTENVALIYEYDDLLDYVEIVENGTLGEGDYGTTLRYRVMVEAAGDDDANDDDTAGSWEVEEFTIPEEVYYWGVVHPRLSDEEPNYIKPSGGGDASPENGGVFWRSYLPYDIDGENSYSTPMYMEGIDSADLQNLSPSAWGYLNNLTIHNLEIAYHGDTQNPVFVEFAKGSGTIFAATMDMVKAEETNDCLLLQNLLDQGNGDILLPADSPIAVLADGSIPSVFENAFTALGRWDDVTKITSAEFLAYDTTAWDTFKATYKKVVVLPAQVLGFYEALCDTTVKENLEAYVSGWGVLQMHIVPPHKGAAKAMTDLTFPGGFGFADSTTDEVTVYGRPLLFDMLEGIDILWDGQVHGGISGDRPLWDNADALQALGNWVGKNMLDNISERQAITGGAPERAIQPSRIVYNHFGNCGELQDLIGAAMRTALIPGLLITDINEDHVWNEFYHDGAWYYFQNDWSNGATRVGTPGGGQDKDYGGGKDISFILAWWGDGRVDAASDRYSNTVTLEFNLTDADGNPVPDAWIEIYSEGWNTSTKYAGFWMRSDADGHAEVQLGDLRNYYVRILSGAGDEPHQESGHVSLTQMVDAEDATDGSVFTMNHQFDEKLVKVTVQDYTAAVNDSFALHVVLTATQRFEYLYHLYSRASGFPVVETPLVDVFLVNGENLNAAQQNEEFDAAAAWLGVAELDETVYPPTDENWHLLVTSHSAAESDHMFDIEVTAEGDPWAPDDDTIGDDDQGGDDDDIGPPDDDDDDDDDDGCGC
ncbi:MAG: transglutaminase domain-containing protein [Alphaproteobacteria bacterium]